MRFGRGNVGHGGGITDHPHMHVRARGLESACQLMVQCTISVLAVKLLRAIFEL